MPPLDAFLAVRFDGWALGLAAAGLVLYGVGARRVRRTGGSWPAARTAGFAIGIASYLAVALGFPGALGGDVRWAFVLRVALTVAVVPALVVLGRPVALLREVFGAGRVDPVAGSRAARVLGSPVVAPLVPLAVFLVLLTPVAGWLRTTPAGDAVVDLVVPLLGLLVAVPLAEPVVEATSTRITGEFLIAFVELVADAIPGILMRLSTTVLDGVTRRAATAPAWAPSPLRGQQLAGDVLWCIAEAADVPALVLLFVRWTRTDRKEARRVDDLSDEEYDALARQHLQGPPA